MRGISAIVSNNRINDFIFKSLSNIKNRGYDSCRVCFNKKEKLVCYKKANTNESDCFDYLDNELSKSEDYFIGIAHTLAKVVTVE